MLSLVLVCRRPTWNIACDNAAAYVDSYRRHNLSQALIAGKPAIVGDENSLCERHLRRSATLCGDKIAGRSAAYDNQTLAKIALIIKKTQQQ